MAPALDNAVYVQQLQQEIMLVCVKENTVAGQEKVRSINEKMGTYKI